MSKKILLSSISIIVLAASSAGAADLPSVKPAPAVPAPIWTGFYAGLNSGYGWGLTPGSYTQAPLFYDQRAIKFAGSPSGLGAANSGKAIINQSGYLGGGQIGFNYQFREKYLIGLETDMQGAEINGQGYYNGAGVTKDIVGGRPDLFNIAGYGQTNASINWLGTLRGRAGYLITSTLLTYATGGLTYGGISANNYFGSLTEERNQTNRLSGQQNLSGSGRIASTLVGWNLGGGFEWMLSPKWSLKSEILYYNLGTSTFSGWGYSPDPGTKTQAVLNTTSVNFAGIIARAGLNYHLNTNDMLQNPISIFPTFANLSGKDAPEDVSLRWSGLYAGLNSGYGWSGHGVQTTSDSYDQRAYEYLGNSGGVPPKPGSVQPMNALSQANSGWSSVNQSGFVGGLQAGYNYQLAKKVVVGIETDIQGSTMQGAGSYSGYAFADYYSTNTHTTVQTHHFSSNGDIQAGMNWFGTVRGRAGYLLTPKLLVFGTGGLSYGGLYAQSNFISSNNNIDITSSDPGILVSQIMLGKGRSTNSLVGWTAGAGLEWMVMSNWSLKTEAIYYDLGSLNLNANGYSPSADASSEAQTYLAVNTKTRIRYDGVIARMGVNYHFDLGKELPVIAKY